MVIVHDNPWIASDPLDQATHRAIRQAMMFEHFKWDPQVQDVSTLCRTPLILQPLAWTQLSQLAEALYVETLAIEEALLGQSRLIKSLALPSRIARLLSQRPEHLATVPRVMRFDFHHTTQGWRITEVKSDVPGGYIEAGAYSALMAQRYRGTRMAGDPGSALVQAVTRCAGRGARVSLVYATAYADDAQVMFYLGRALERAGHHVLHAAPDHPDWADAGVVLRFYPAEWLVNLPRSSGWERFFTCSQARICNPGWALLTQSKRWPIVLDQTGVDAPLWRALLPQTLPVDRRLLNDTNWVFKPALGRVGGMIGMRGCTTEDDWRQIRQAVRRYPWHWVMQERFEPTPWQTHDGNRFPCLGVYVIDGRAAGVYGRAAQHGLVNHSAQELAVLVGPNYTQSQHSIPDTTGSETAWSWTH